MATIDTLVVEIVLAVDKFRKGMVEAQSATRAVKQQTSQSAKEWEALANRANDALVGLGRRALGVAGILLGGLGIEKLVSRFVPFNAELGRTAHFLGVSERDLLIWQRAGATVGVTAEEITQNIVGVADALGKFRYLGIGDIGPMFGQFGITLKDQQGNWKTAVQLLGELAVKFKNLDPQRKQAFITQFGLTEGMRNLLDLGEKLAPLLADTSRLIGKFGTDNTRSATALQREWANTETVFNNFGRSLSRVIEGPGVAFLKWTQDAVLAYQRLIDVDEANKKRARTEGYPFNVTPGGTMPWWLRLLGIAGGRAATSPNAPRRRLAPAANAERVGEGSIVKWEDYTGRIGDFFQNRGFDVLPPPGAGKQSSVTNNNTPVHVASLVVYSAAKDAAGIAGDIRTSLEGSVAAQANTGQV